MNAGGADFRPREPGLLDIAQGIARLQRLAADALEIDVDSRWCDPPRRHGRGGPPRLSVFRLSRWIVWRNPDYGVVDVLENR